MRNFKPELEELGSRILMDANPVPIAIPNNAPPTSGYYDTPTPAQIAVQKQQMDVTTLAQAQTARITLLNQLNEIALRNKAAGPDVQNSNVVSGSFKSVYYTVRFILDHDDVIVIKAQLYDLYNRFPSLPHR